MCLISCKKSGKLNPQHFKFAALKDQLNSKQA